MGPVDRWTDGPVGRGTGGPVDRWAVGRGPWAGGTGGTGGPVDCQSARYSGWRALGLVREWPSGCLPLSNARFSVCSLPQDIPA